MAKKNLSTEKSSKAVSSALPAASSSTEQENKYTNLTNEDRRIEIEKFKPTGDFEKDFTELCALVGMPSLCVTARPKRPTYALLSPPDTSMSKGIKEDRKNASSQNHEVLKPIDQDTLPPRTYLVADDIYEYLKPRVEIDTEEEGSKSHVKEIYVRGWQVDKRFIEILTITMPELEHLTVLDFWNTGLNDDTLLALGHCLAPSTTLKTLRLDGNEHTIEERFDIFLSEKSFIQSISLKCCSLSDKGALVIGKSLVENKNLLTLNLCFNKITDVGAKHLAEGLRLNRSLLSLNLGSNEISDDGAKQIAETISTFPLSHEQVVARRFLKSHLNSEEALSPTHSSQERSPTDSRSFNKEDKKKNTKKKDQNSKLNKENAIKRGPSTSDTKGGKNQKAKTAPKQDRNKTPQQDTEGLFEYKNPLMEKTQERNGELWVPGNRCLINLNLARNKISEAGLSFLVAAVKYQIELANEENRTVATGLMRLSLQKNDFSIEHPTYIQLTELMKTRDPYYKPSSSPITESNNDEN